MIKERAKEELEKSISKTLGPQYSDFDLTHPQNEAFGDFTLNVALRAAKELSRSPLELAHELADQIKENSDYFEKVEVVSPGFINLTIKNGALINEIKVIAKDDNSYGRSELLKGKKLMVEFAHPNTHKEFHIGHLRNISLGESLVRLQEALGAVVIRANYQGDVGLHVAKAIWGIMNKAKGTRHPFDKLRASKAEVEGGSLLERIRFLGQCYVEGNRSYEGEHKDEVVEINKKIYAQDPEVIGIWKETRRWSLEYFDEIYKLLGAHFDRFYFESEVSQPGREIAEEALKKGILTESEGAVIFDGTVYGLDKRVFLTSENLPTYEAKELGLAALEFSQFGRIDQCLHVVGPEQQSFFKVTFKVEELIDPDKYGGKQFHFAYGYVQLKEGKMSSRKGNVVTALSVIEAAKEAVRKLVKSGLASPDEVESSIEAVALGAVKYSLLRGEARNDIAFDLKESIALEGNSGPYLQYTYARARSVLRKSQIPNPKSKTISNNQSSGSAVPEPLGIWNLDIDWNLELENWDFGPEERALLRTLYKFPEVVEAAALSHSPHLVCNFLYDLAQKFNLFYNNVPILTKSSSNVIPADAGIHRFRIKSGMTGRESNFRLALTDATAQILKNGLDLLGIGAPERM